MSFQPEYFTLATDPRRKSQSVFDDRAVPVLACMPMSKQRKESNVWQDMRKAKEESYFEKKEKETLQRLAVKKDEQILRSPVSGEQMEKNVISGITVYRCPTSGGVWLDAQSAQRLRESAESGEENFELLKSFFGNLP